MDPDVETLRYNHDNKPPSAANRGYDQRTAPACVVLVPSNIMNLIKRNKARLEKLTLYEVNEEAEEEAETVNERVSEMTRRSRERIQCEGFFELGEDDGLPEVDEDDDMVESEPLWSKQDEWDSDQEKDDPEVASEEEEEDEYTCM
jgi:hypothetical protein